MFFFPVIIQTFIKTNYKHRFHCRISVIFSIFPKLLLIYLTIVGYSSTDQIQNALKDNVMHNCPFPSCQATLAAICKLEKQNNFENRTHKGRQVKSCKSYIKKLRTKTQPAFTCSRLTIETLDAIGVVVVSLM